MDNDLKNIGVACALASLVDGLSLTKISLPYLRGSNGIYHIKSDDGEISRLINLNDDYLEEDGMGALCEVLEYTHKKLTGKDASLPCLDYASQMEAMTLIVNELRGKAREYLADKYSHKDDKTLSAGERALINLEDKIFTFQEAFFNDTEETSRDFEALEYGMSYLDEIYGMNPTDPNIVSKDCDIMDLEYAFDEACRFIEEITSEDPEYLQEFLEQIGYGSNEDDNQDNMFKYCTYDDTNDCDDKADDLDKYSELDYTTYRQAKEDYNNAKLGKKFEEKEITDKEINNSLKEYISDKYLEKLGERMGLENPDMLKKLCDKANELFGEDIDLPKDDLARLDEILNKDDWAKLGEIFAEDISEEEFDALGGETLQEMLDDEDDMGDNIK